MDTAVTAWLLAQLGTSTDTADLEVRYARLGTARAVALEVLAERLAALVMDQPATINVSSVVSVAYAENIRAIERQIERLEAGQPPAPDDPDDGSAGGFGLIQLTGRPRR